MRTYGLFFKHARGEERRFGKFQFAEGQTVSGIAHPLLPQEAQQAATAEAANVNSSLKGGVRVYVGRLDLREERGDGTFVKKVPESSAVATAA